jgi:hypothetical protein
VHALSTRIRNRLRLIGWPRDLEVALEPLPAKLAVVLCTYQRVERLSHTLAQLAAQDVAVQAVIWNNGPHRDAVDAVAADAGIDASVTHSKRNIGGFGRFYLARALRCQGHLNVVFIDDDQDFGPSTIGHLVDAHRPGSLSGWWAYRFDDPTDYTVRTRVEAGASAAYVGTCGMIADTEIFEQAALFACPSRYWFVEDLWLSYVANHLVGWPLFRSPAEFEFVPDGRDQYLRLGRTKTRLLRYLVAQGWDLGIGSAPRPNPATHAESGHFVAD